MNAPAVPARSIIVPCYNEERNLEELVRRTLRAVSRHRIAAELVLIDDGSEDGTRESIKTAARRHEEVRGCYHDDNRGIAEAWKTGVAASRAPVVLITDADLQYAPEDIPRLYQRLVEGDSDLVQGWRSGRDVQDGYRSALSGAFSLLLNRLFGTRLRDIKSGFLCTRRDTFAALLETRYRYRRLQHFIVVNAAKGFRIRQEPVGFGKRRAGRSFIRSPIWFGLTSFTDLPRAFWEFRVVTAGGRPADVRDRRHLRRGRHPIDDPAPRPSRSGR